MAAAATPEATEDLGQDAYGEKEYWERRYSQTSCAEFEWLQSYDELAPSLGPPLQEALKRLGPARSQLSVLDVGCGTSFLGASLGKLCGGTSVSLTSLDVSETLVARLEGAPRAGATAVAMDCTDMSALEDGSFDVVVDKGTMDSLACGPDSVKRIASYVSHAHRVLAPGGLFLVVSWRPPEARQKALETAVPEGWGSVAARRIPKPALSVALLPKAPSEGDSHFLYVLVKRQQEDDSKAE